METFSALLAFCAGNSPVTGEFHAQRPVTRSFDVIFDLRLNKRLSKQYRRWWFETLLRSLWRHSNGRGNRSLSQRASYEETVPMSWRHSGRRSWNRSLQLTSLSHLNNYNHATRRLPGTGLFFFYQKPGEVLQRRKIQTPHCPLWRESICSHDSPLRNGQ